MGESFISEASRKELESLISTFREFESVGRGISGVESAIRRLGYSMRESAEGAEELKKKFEDIGFKFDMISEKSVEQAVKALRIIRDEMEDATGQTLENLKRAEKEIVETLLKMGEDQRTAWQKASQYAQEGMQTISRTFTTATRDIRSSIESEISHYVPPSLRNLGLIGFLIGGMIWAHERFKTQVATMTATWMQMVGDMTGAVRKASGMWGEFFGRWQFAMSIDEMTRVMGRAGLLVDELTSKVGLTTRQFADLRRETFGIINRAVELDAVAGRQWGATLERLNQLHLNWGISMKEGLASLDGITKMFREAGLAAGPYAQAIFDLQGRLGPLAIDLKRVAETTILFSDIMKGLGMPQGSLALTTKATEELYGSFQKLSLPWQAILGGVIAPGATGLRAIYEFQKLTTFGVTELRAPVPGLGEAGRLIRFQEAMPMLLMEQFRRFSMFGRSPEENAYIMQTQLGYSRSTSILLAELLEKYKEHPEKLQEALGRKKVLDAIKDDSKSIIDVIKSEVPTITRLLESIKNLAQFLFKLLAESLPAIAAVLVGIATFDRPLISKGWEALKETFSPEAINKIRKQLSDIAGIQKEMLPFSGQAFREMFVGSKAEALAGVVGTIGGFAWDLAKGAFKGALSVGGGFITEAWGKIGGLITGIGEAFGEKVAEEIKLAHGRIEGGVLKFTATSNTTYEIPVEFLRALNINVEAIPGGKGS